MSTQIAVLAWNLLKTGDSKTSLIKSYYFFLQKMNIYFSINIS
jgi:hypothetical protein